MPLLSNDLFLAQLKALFDAQHARPTGKGSIYLTQKSAAAAQSSRDSAYPSGAARRALLEKPGLRAVVTTLNIRARYRSASARTAALAAFARAIWPPEFIRRFAGRCAASASESSAVESGRGFLSRG
jgi:hypothetical protein